MAPCLFSSLESLPYEITLILVSFLDTLSIERLSCTSRRWHSDEDVWKIACGKRGIFCVERKERKRGEWETEEDGDAEEEEGKSCWRQMYMKQKVTCVQVLSAVHVKSWEHSPGDLPLQKICMLGSGGVGLTAIVRQFLLEELFMRYDPTLFELYYAEVLVKGERRFLEITDTAGPEEYSALRHQDIISHKIFMFVFCVTTHSSFQRIDKIIAETAEAHKDTGFHGVLVGNKVDLTEHRMVSKAEGEHKAKQWNMPYMETSMYDRRSILNAFGVLLKDAAFFGQVPSPTKRNRRGRRRRLRRGECALL